MSIELEPGWIGTIVFDGYVMRALNMPGKIIIMSRGEHVLFW